MNHRLTPHPCRSLAAVALLIGGLASLAQADTVTVCLNGSCDFTSVGAAVDAAAEGDLILVAAGTYMLSGPVSLYDKDLVIRGAVDASGRPATVLNGQNTAYHINALHQTSATVIENLVLTNGRGSQSGSIYMFGCQGTTFRNCSVRGNMGGAINLNSSSVRMIGCEIMDNTAAPGTAAGGGLYVGGAASLIDCVVSGNAASYSGGGLYVPSGSVVNLTRTRICGNTAPNSAQIGHSPTGIINDLGGSCVMSACNACPLPCVGDVNSDRAVDGADLGMMLSAWGTAGPADLNNDSTVNGADLGILLSAWGTCG